MTGTPATGVLTEPWGVTTPGVADDAAVVPVTGARVDGVVLELTPGRAGSVTGGNAPSRGIVTVGIETVGTATLGRVTVGTALGTVTLGTLGSVTVGTVTGLVLGKGVRLGTVTELGDTWGVPGSCTADGDGSVRAPAATPPRTSAAEAIPPHPLPPAAHDLSSTPWSPLVDDVSSAAVGWR